MKKDFMQRTNTPITTITNGFDHEDFNNKHPQIKSEKFRILYTGMFLPDQNPPELWEVLADLLKENIDFSNALEIQFVGKADAGILYDIKTNGLEPYLKLNDYVPHADLASLQQSAAVLLLCINRIPNASYILTGKVFEYLSAGKPILAICPENSDIAAIIQQTETGIVVPFMEKKQLKEAVVKLFQFYKNGQDFSEPKKIEEYTRMALTERMATLLNQLSSK
jgi:glycosyltransferase involved in cell wall biosynthesis